MNHNVNILYAGNLIHMKGSFDPQEVTTHRLITLPWRPLTNTQIDPPNLQF